MQDKSEWRASKLAAKLGMTQEALRIRIAYWLANGVITDSKASRGELMYRAAGTVLDESPAESACMCLQLFGLINESVADILVRVYT